ncbi:TPA: Eaa protein [Escherichia coli]|nr:Eaa protein [Escherichia coli]
MITITKGRLLTIKQWRETYGPGSNVVLPAEEAEELARIALASLEADPVKRVNSDQMHRVCLEANRYLDKYDAMAKEVNKLLGRIAPPAPVLPHEWRLSNAQAFIERYSPPSVEEAALFAWNSCRAAMLQSGNFRENKNSSTNNFREIAETSTNYPAIPSEVLSAILKVARIRADFDDFDGDRRGIGDCLDEAEQELIVTINKYASQLAAEPIAPNDVREQTAIPQVPVTPDGWISCSERMPDDTKMLLAFSQGQIVAAYWNWVMSPIDYKKYRAFTYLSGNILDDVTHWMPLPEPPQGVNRG